VNRQTVVYQVIVYQQEQGADATGGQHIIMLLRTPDEALARFLVAQALLWPRHPGEQQESMGYCAELRRGHHSGPLDAGSWRPTRPDHTTCDVALLDPDTGSLDWAHNQPTYVVMTEELRCTVTSSSHGPRKGGLHEGH
jgi:hypothetical protein